MSHKDELPESFFVLWVFLDQIKQQIEKNERPKELDKIYQLSIDLRLTTFSDEEKHLINIYEKLLAIQQKTAMTTTDLHKIIFAIGLMELGVTLNHFTDEKLLEMFRKILEGSK